MENIDTYSNTVNEKKESNSDVQKLLSQPYKYGFTTDVEVEEFPKGINTDIIKLISEKWLFINVSSIKYFQFYEKRKRLCLLENFRSDNYKEKKTLL